MSDFAASCTLIVADDEMANRMVATGNFGLVGLDEDDEEKMIEAEDGDEALEALDNAQDNEDPIIMLLDLHMPPGKGGDGAAIAVQEKWDEYKRKPFLVCCSAEVLEDLKAKPWADNFHYFAKKPLMQDVAQEIHDECQKWFEAGKPAKWKYD
mmetsp:Transcript_47855/g.126823  ORF Transcript_47855/g.126823 Transcript_47855/m.126823 type:complete len:153 (+) Transcript_47855:52-510(+)